MAWIDTSHSETQNVGVDEDGNPIAEDVWVTSGYDDGQGSSYGTTGQPYTPFEAGFTGSAAITPDPTLGFLNGLKNADGSWNLPKIATAGLTLAGAIQAYNQAKNPPQTGYQGGIPAFTGVRKQVPTAQTARPGAGGQRYFTNTAFSLPATATTASGLPAAQAAVAAQKAALATQNQLRTPVASTQDPAVTAAAQQAAQDKFFGRTTPAAPAAQAPLTLATNTPNMTPQQKAMYYNNLIGRGYSDADIRTAAGPQTDENWNALKGLAINPPAAPVEFTPEKQYIPTATAAAKYTPEQPFVQPAKPIRMAAQGGLMGLAKGGSTNPRYLQGSTDGMADEIPATIDGEQPAALAHGEFVVPADVVSHLGNGNSDAGADVLYKMMDKIRKARTGTKKQGKQIDPNKFTAAAGGLAYAAGGVVSPDGTRGFPTGGTVPTGTVGTESNLSNWAGPYVTDMLGKGQALSTMPYQAYQGPLSAGDSALQTQAYGLASGLQTPASIGQAANTAGNVASAAGNLSYSPTQATNQFTAPGQYSAAQNTSAFNQPGQYTASQNASSFVTPTNTGYTAAPDITSQKFTDPGVASSYMNPYLQQSLNPQLQEARRQSQISQQGSNAQATQAGAFGGARQGILAAENQRNLSSNLSNITGQGYNTAYTTGQNQFNADQSRNMTAQQANQAAANQASQFGAQQNMTAAQLAAQYGLSAQQANEASRQFGANYGMQGAQTAAQYGLAAQNANEASRQFGAQYGMTGAQNTAQYGQQAQAQNAQENQFAANYGLQGLNTQLQAAQAQGNLGNMQNQAGLANLNTMAGLGATQQATQQAGIAADQAAFNQERDNPYKMVQYQQSLLQGLPLAAQSYNIQTNPYSAAANVLSGVNAVTG